MKNDDGGSNFFTFHDSLLPFFITFAPDMKKSMVIILLTAGLLMSCQGNRQQQKDQLRQQLRSEYYQQELEKAQRELAHTDSLLQVLEADLDSLNVDHRLLLDSLSHEADVQGARIRYLHRKQQEL